jgi:hypothetical protein
MGSTTPPVAAQWVAFFVQRLHKLGWLDGRNVAIEYRWAEGRSERYAEIAAELYAGNVAARSRQGRGAGAQGSAGMVGAVTRAIRQMDREIPDALRKSQRWVCRGSGAARLSSRLHSEFRRSGHHQ